jgi:Flp pilus assembly pilin Flp
MNDTRSNAISHPLRRRSLVADTRGAGLVEYIILVGLIALVAIAGFEKFGEKVNRKAERLGEQVEAIGD